MRVIGARQRPVPWIALAVLLVVGGALLAWLLVQSAADRTSVLVAARSLSPGHVLEAADVRLVDVGVEGEAAVIPASEREALAGQVVVAAIPEGALLSPGQFAADGGLPAGTVVVGALLGPGELPVPNLRAGDAVEMVAVTGSQGAERTSLGEASVFTTTPGTQASTLFVSLAVPTAQAQEVADTVAQQRLRLILLPGGQG
jgi:hypothetical protein